MSEVPAKKIAHLTPAEVAALRDQLNSELAEAEEEHRRIQEEVQRILVDAREGVAVPEGQNQQMKAGAKARATFEKYQRAVERFRIFVDEGIVPEDLAG